MTYLLTRNQDTEPNQFQARESQIKLNNHHADSIDDIDLSNTVELLDQ